ncbi:MAG: T9SS type A sorting domain-containing protein [Saprospiraceae bacterium]
MKTYSTLFLVFSCTLLARSQVDMGTSASLYSQDFAGLGLVVYNGTSTNNTNILNWSAQRTGAGITQTPSTGSATTGDLYNYGVLGVNPASDRALGSVGSSNASAGSFAYGVLLRNNSGVGLGRTTLTVSYIGEQWHQENNASAQAISFYYKRSSSPITALQPNSNSTWTAVPALNFNKLKSSAIGALDGNAAANRLAISSIITFPTALGNGEYIFLKWDDPDQLGNDHGLAIDDVTISWQQSNSLPIQLTSFTANKSIHTVKLNWSTASEKNSREFELEKAGYNIKFDLLLKLAGAGTSLTNRDYSYTDMNPYPGINYYRLKLVDLDGSSITTKIISVNFNEENLSQIFPNPVGAELKIKLNHLSNQPTSIYLMDLHGKRLKAWNYETHKTILNLDVQDIPNGIYLLELSDTHQLEIFRIVKL